MANTKDKHRETMITYLSDPDNDWPTRTVLAVDVIGYKHQSQLYKIFTTDELSGIEAEALGVRRKKYSSQLAQVDKGLLDKAKTGDPSACKLVYQKFEGWAERNELSGPDGQPVDHKWTVEFINATSEDKPET